MPISPNVQIAAVISTESTLQRLEPEQSVAVAELEGRVHAALTTYSNVHRGAGHFSEATTALYERAREIVLDELGLDKKRYTVIFASPDGANRLGAHLDPDEYRVISSQDLGLPLGVRALAVARKALPKGIPPRTGGGATRLVSRDSIVWEGIPAKFEAGTPGILNVIAFACALQLTRQFGKDAFRTSASASADLADTLYHDALAQYSGMPLLRALRDSTLGRGNQVPVGLGMAPYANLDNAASSPTFPAVWDTVCKVWRQPHDARRAIVSEVKRICAEFLGAPADEYAVVFTANTTESIDHVARSLKSSVDSEMEPVVLNTWLEHHSNELPWRWLPGVALQRLGVDDQGFVDLDELEQILERYNLRQECGQQRIALVAISGASNVLGTCNDLERVCKLAHKYGARVLVDAAQLVAHRRIDMQECDIDYLAFSGHKVYAPFGCGALVARRSILGRDPLAWERIKACGEENVVGIAAMGKAMVLMQRIGMDLVEAEEQRLTLRALRGLKSMSEIELWGATEPEAPQFAQRTSVIAFFVKQVPHNLVACELAEQAGIGVRSGCHCAHMLVKRMLQIPDGRPKLADRFHETFPGFVGAMMPGVVRVSFGLGNDDQDVDRLLYALREIAAPRRSWLNRSLSAHHGGTAWLPRSRVRPRVKRWVNEQLERVYGSYYNSRRASAISR